MAKTKVKFQCKQKLSWFKKMQIHDICICSPTDTFVDIHNIFFTLKEKFGVKCELTFCDGERTFYIT